MLRCASYDKRPKQFQLQVQKQASLKASAYLEILVLINNDKLLILHSALFQLKKRYLLHEWKKSKEKFQIPLE
jgi:hypothetical protein